MAEALVRAIRSIPGIYEGQTGAIDEERALALEARGIVEILGEAEEEEAQTDDGDDGDGEPGDLDPDGDEFADDE